MESQQKNDQTTMPADIEAHIDTFLAQLSHAGRSEKTIRSYHHDLLIFFDWLLQKHPHIQSVHDISRPQIHQFFGYLDRRRNNAYSTRRRRMSSLGLFFDVLVYENVFTKENNPFPDFKQHPIKHKGSDGDKPVIYLEYEEMKNFMDQIFFREDRRGGRQPWMNARDICLFDLLLCTGLRISELCGLTVEQAQDMTIKQLLGVIGKGNKYRPIPVPHETHIQRVHDYLRRRPHTEDHDALFLTKTHRPLQPRDIQYVIKTYAKRAGIKKNVSPHKLRHTFASMLIKNHVDIRKIQMLLGHANISTTQIYTHLDIQDQKDAVQELPDW